MRIRALFLILLIFFLGACNFNKKEFDYVEIVGEKIKIETAKTSAEKQKGLMFRESLCDNCGMLFVFEEEERHSFWMKNTLIPLDIIFINAKLNVVDIKRAIPCEEYPCQLYTSKEKALYVLETNAYKFNEDIVDKKEKMIFK